MKKQNEKSNTVKDATSYAKHLGYQGEKQVLVVDGFVISHKNQSWTSFCDCLREQNAMFVVILVVCQLKAAVR